MNAIGYIRVSTEEQAREGISLENQREKVIAYCQLNDLNLVEIIEDAGLSAKNLNREGMQELMSKTKHREIDSVIVYKLDRLSRSVRDTITLIEMFEKNKIAFHSIVDHIDTKTATGRFFLNIMASLAQMERELIGERTKDALQLKFQKGERVGHTPFGYDLAEDKVNLIQNIREQEAVRLIVDLRGQGYTYRHICSELENRGFTPKAGKWQATKVRNIIHYQERRLAA